MSNLLFDLPEEIQVKVMKMNPRPFDEEFKMKLHDYKSWWYTVVSNYRNPHYIYQNIWKRKGNPKYWFRCDAMHEDSEAESDEEGGQEEFDDSGYEEFKRTRRYKELREFVSAYDRGENVDWMDPDDPWVGAYISMCTRTKGLHFKTS